jgi:hypothetical protein
MRRVLQGRNAPATVLGILALVVASAGGAYAANSGGGKISVCVHRSDGGLYRAHHCAKHDGRLSWNSRGPKGNAGSPGVTTAWAAEVYPTAAVPQSDGHVATFKFTAPSAGFVDLTAQFQVRIHNTPNVDCHVQNQIAATPTVLSVAPGATPRGYMDNWINGNLPTQFGAGTFLGLDESVSDVLPVVAGSNTFFLNGHADCPGALWGPINFTALSVNHNPTATVTAP